MTEKKKSYNREYQRTRRATDEEYRKRTVAANRRSNLKRRAQYDAEIQKIKSLRDAVGLRVLEIGEANGLTYSQVYGVEVCNRIPDVAEYIEMVRKTLEQKQAAFDRWLKENGYDAG